MKWWKSTLCYSRSCVCSCAMHAHSYVSNSVISFTSLLLYDFAVISHIQICQGTARKCTCINSNLHKFLCTQIIRLRLLKRAMQIIFNFDLLSAIDAFALWNAECIVRLSILFLLCARDATKMWNEMENFWYSSIFPVPYVESCRRTLRRYRPFIESPRYGAAK